MLLKCRSLSYYRPIIEDIGMTPESYGREQTRAIKLLHFDKSKHQYKNNLEVLSK